MDQMNQTVVGIFDNADQAKMAAQQLKAAGFSLDDVDTISRDSENSSNYYNSTGTATEAVGDAAGRTGDGISNFFSNLFGDDTDDASRYSHAARNSHSMVTVHCKSADHAHKAAEILDNAGAIDVNEKAQQTGYKANNMAAGAAANTNQTGNNEVSAKVIEENLQVGKRVEQTGGARLRSRIVERPVEANVRLREEHVNVERTPVNRPATEADFNAFKEGDVEVTERAERAVVSKEARVVEEVTLGKEVTEREETIRDTVRKTEVDVEQLGAKDVRNDDRKNS
ncbi:YsnF/AvaK domain-containing protein [Hymenobacter actinosclerus]|uniref:Conserved domain-containing protein n=1 Tax=Hymenobacter actinosclerus TaxID=82805 RepID=A0A1I0H091_9BACT|nr:YsnF/AvaK domain-containing protein [Hymenobacter actinosclerus]SET76929.1 conserved domain-containing protein [Hymenobacter actinosclerus]